MALFILADAAFAGRVVDILQSVKRKQHKYQCEFCFYSSKHSWILKRHMLTHSGEKSYICKVCSKSFRQKAHLNGHKRTHLPVDAPSDKTKIIKHIQKTEMKACF